MAALGPFFAVDIHPPDALPVQPWRPLLDLVEQPGLMTTRIDALGLRSNSAGDLAGCWDASTDQPGCAACVPFDSHSP